MIFDTIRKCFYEPKEEMMLAEDGYTPVNKDEEWYVQMPEATALMRVLVTDVTQHTVEVRDTHYSAATRYRHESLKFVERVR